MNTNRMEQIASIEKLQQCLEPLPSSPEEIQNLITELHFAYQNFKFGKENPIVEEWQILWDAAYYLLTAYTNPRRRSRLENNVVEDALAISGLVFELLGLYAQMHQDTVLQRECFLNASIANTLSKYEANSAVLAKRYLEKNLLIQDIQSFSSQPELYGSNFVFAILAREHFWVYQNGRIFANVFSELGDDLENLDSVGYGTEATFWILMSYGTIQHANYMIGGDNNHYQAAIRFFRRARQFALDYELISEHWLTSRILDCVTVLSGRRR